MEIAPKPDAAPESTRRTREMAMLNRNAATHLLLVVSILLLAFIYIGYRLSTRGAAPAETADTAAPPSGFDPAAGAESAESDALALRPQGSLPPGLVPPGASSDGDSFEWVPSTGGEELSLAPPPSDGAPVAAPEADFPFAAPPSAPTQHSGEIAGLVPTPPQDVAIPDMRPPGGSPAMPTPEQIAGHVASMLPPPPGETPEPESVPSLPVDFMPVPGGDSLKPPGSATEPQMSPLPIPVPGSSPTPAESPPALSPPASMPVDPPSGGGALAPPSSSSGVGDDVPGEEYDDYEYDGQVYDDAEYVEDADDFVPVAEPQTPPPAPRETAPHLVPPPQPPGPPAAPRNPAPSSGIEHYDEYYEDPPLGNSESLRIYVVRPGDTLSSIAARELGSNSLADNIFLLNRDVIDDPDHLLVGVKIRLPVREGYGAYENGAAADPGRRPTQGLGRTHIVARGDTLSSIAQRYYGNSAAWRFLYESNRNIVPNPNRLSIGTELAIPPYEDN